LLVPTHVVFVHARDIRATLREALIELADDLPSAIGFHSGPSKSADIGQILVKGVHGPGRLVAVLIASVSTP
jgi:L-lactate dehydrogenase complex protein LldG